MDADGYIHKAYFDGNPQLVAAITAIREDLTARAVAADQEFLRDILSVLSDADNTFAMGAHRDNPIRLNLQRLQAEIRARL